MSNQLKKILIIPADSIANEVSRSFNFAKGLTSYFDVYKLTWYDPQGAEFENYKITKTHTLKCFLKSLFIRTKIIRNEKHNFNEVYLPRIINAILYRFIGNINSLKILRRFNTFVLNNFLKKNKFDILFYADGFDNYAAIERDDTLIISDVQDDFDNTDFRSNKYHRDYGTKYFNISKLNYTISEDTAKHLNEFYKSSFKVLPNGADFKSIINVNKSKIEYLKKKYDLTSKFIVSYIGGKVWVDNNLFSKLLKLAQDNDSDIHFLIIGNIPKLNYSNVTYLGPVPNQDTYPFYQLSNCGILLRDSNNLDFLINSHPIKIIQYSAASKPVITPNIAWLKNEGFRNILMIDNYTPENLLKKILDIKRNNLTYSVDEKWLAYDWEIIIETIFNDIINLLKN